MNVFGLGPMELLLVLLVALILFGPGRLPEVGKALGKGIREFRRTVSDLSTEITEDFSEAERRRDRTNPPRPKDQEPPEQKF